MEISNNQRSDMLRVHGKLRNVINYVDDCRDINVSHLRDIEEAICVLQQVGSFKPKKKHDGSSLWWTDWVYAEESEPEDD
jgi:hypothetical protein